MYVKKSVLVTLMLVTLTMILYILVDHRMIMASDSTEITAYSMDLSAAADAGRSVQYTTMGDPGGDRSFRFFVSPERSMGPSAEPPRIRWFCVDAGVWLEVDVQVEVKDGAVRP